MTIMTGSYPYHFKPNVYQGNIDWEKNHLFMFGIGFGLTKTDNSSHRYKLNDH